MTERIFGWEAVTRDGRLYTSGVLNGKNRGGYDALPHKDIALFRIVMFFHEPGKSNGRIVMDLRKVNLLTIHLDDGERVIYRTRKELIQGIGAGLEGGPRKCILVGTQKLIKGQKAYRLHWIFEDTGEIHCTGQFYEGIENRLADKSWFYGVSLMPGEQV